VPSLLNNGTIALSVSGGTGATFMRVNRDDGITAAGSFASDFSTAFNLLLSVTAEGTANYSRALAHSLSAAPADEPPGTLLLQIIWDLTGGLFLAVGLSPLINQAVERTAVYALLRENVTVWASIEQVLETVRSNPEASPLASFLAIERLIWNEGLMWRIFRYVAKELSWYVIAFALAKVIELVIVPEAEVAEFSVEFSIWAYETVSDIMAYANSSAGAAHLARIAARSTPAPAMIRAA
jgi:hypothetical protein